MIDTRQPRVVTGRVRPGVGSTHAVRVFPVRDSDRYSEASVAMPMVALCGSKCSILDYANLAEDVMLSGGNHCLKCVEALKFSRAARDGQ